MKRCRKGFLITDMVAALVLLTVLTVALAGAVFAQRQALRKLQLSQAAMAMCEQAAAAVQTGKPLPKNNTETQYQLAAVADLDPPAPKLVWAKITVTHKGRSADLFAAVPVKAMDGGSK